MMKIKANIQEVQARGGGGGRMFDDCEPRARNLSSLFASAGVLLEPGGDWIRNFLVVAWGANSCSHAAVEG